MEPGRGRRPARHRRRRSTWMRGPKIACSPHHARGAGGRHSQRRGGSGRRLPIGGLALAATLLIAVVSCVALRTPRRTGCRAARGGEPPRPDARAVRTVQIAYRQARGQIESVGVDVARRSVRQPVPARPGSGVRRVSGGRLSRERWRHSIGSRPCIRTRSRCCSTRASAGCWPATMPARSRRSKPRPGSATRRSPTTCRGSSPSRSSDRASPRRARRFGRAVPRPEHPRGGGVCRRRAARRVTGAAAATMTRPQCSAWTAIAVVAGDRRAGGAVRHSPAARSAPTRCCARRTLGRRSRCYERALETARETAARGRHRARLAGPGPDRQSARAGRGHGRAGVVEALAIVERLDDRVRIADANYLMAAIERAARNPRRRSRTPSARWRSPIDPGSSRHRAGGAATRRLAGSRRRRRKGTCRAGRRQRASRRRLGASKDRRCIFSAIACSPSAATSSRSSC